MKRPFSIIALDQSPRVCQENAFFSSPMWVFFAFDVSSKVDETGTWTHLPMYDDPVLGAGASVRMFFRLLFTPQKRSGVGNVGPIRGRKREVDRGDNKFFFSSVQMTNSPGGFGLRRCPDLECSGKKVIFALPVRDQVERKLKFISDLQTSHYRKHSFNFV